MFRCGTIGGQEKEFHQVIRHIAWLDLIYTVQFQSFGESISQRQLNNLYKTWFSSVCLSIEQSDCRQGWFGQPTLQGFKLLQENYDEVMVLLNENGDKFQIDTREWIVLCAFIERFMFEQTKGTRFEF